MSYFDQPTLTWQQKLGCIAYTLVGGAISILSVPISGAAPFYIFPGIALAVALGGVLFVKKFIRDKDG